MRKGILFFPFLLLGCAQAPVSSSEAGSEESFSSGSEPSVPVEAPGKINLYEEGNVPYDGEESVREYAFLTSYLFHEKKRPNGSRKRERTARGSHGLFEVDHQFDSFQDLPEASVWMNHALAFLKERGFSYYEVKQ